MKAIKRRVLFLGSKKQGYKVFDTMHTLSPDTLVGVITFDDSDDTRSYHKNFKSQADDLGVPLYIAKNRTHSEELIRELKPDLCLVAGWHWILGKEVLDEVPYGFVGIHNSLLPRYRGGSPLIWPFIHGEREVGFSYFSFTEGMDDGDIWAQGKVNVGPNDYISAILSRLEEKTIEVLREIYPKILDGSLQPIPQDHTKATYCSQRFPSDGIINWDLPAQYIYNYIRAQSDPYPGAFTFYNGEKIGIWRAELFTNIYYGTPGQVARICSDGVFVICGDDRAVILQEIEVDGKRRRAEDYLKSIAIRLGSR